MAPVKCKMCQNIITGSRNNRGIKCDGACGESYHISCANISDTLLKHIIEKSAAWICNTCKPSKRRSIIDEVQSIPLDNTLLDSSAGIPQILKVLFDLRDRIINIENSQQFLSVVIDEMKQKMQSVLDENKVLKNKIIRLESNQSLFEIKFNRMEAIVDKQVRDTIQNDVVITGLPYNTEIKDEMVNSLLRLLEIETQDDDIQSLYAVKPHNSNKSGKKPMLIIKTNNLEIKNNILLQYKNKTRNNKNKNISTSDLDIEWPIPFAACNIHIMNHLSPLQTRLYAAAKIIKQKHNLKYLWCTQGKILLRKDSSSNIFKIDSFNDIKHVERTFLGIENEPESIVEDEDEAT